MTTLSSEEAYSYIKSVLDSSEIKIISVDGWTGAGKSCFLKNFEIESNKLSMDDYFEKNQGVYLDVIRYDELKKIISEFEGLIIIEGICILEVLDNIGIKPDLKIYVKRLGAGETWFEEEYVNKKTAEDVFQEDDKNLEFDIITGEKRVISDVEKEMTEKREGVFYDLVRYHYEYKPHISPDVIYERLDVSDE
jgi:uridine kinase